ncbi:FoF1 ATP synthase subunit delta/epsilon [Acidobacteriota bacterium]
MSNGLPSELKLKVITSQQLLVDENVAEVSLPGLDGCLGILPGHRELLVALGIGEIVYTKGQGEKTFGVQGGYAKINPGSVSVYTELSDNATHLTDKG